MTGLIGPNGSGKTTLMRILAGVMRPRGGELRFDGRALDSWSELNRYRRVVGYLPQDPRWAKGWLARDYVEYVASAYGVPRAERAAAGAAALDVTGATPYSGRKLGSLSGGQEQRVHLATAIVHSPRVLILDEPTVGLDPSERVRIRAFLRSQGQSRIVLVSTHLMDDVALGADRVLVMNEGALKWAGTVAEMAALGREAEGVSAAEDAYLKLVEE
ncbi:MAG: ATP-binding cassette domain-containing protein [Bifidobacteriaceae bacterium]|nr:ATP-binding cassette domain-containing protein [Bifidobacteriaceae bacterium]